MTTYQYKAIRTRQTPSGDWLVLFAASAIEIDMWVGIPQKKQIGTRETTGFQREEDPKRLREISSFYQNDKNIIQNPLLCALRSVGQGKVVFQPNDVETDNYIQYGYLTIDADPLEELSLLELLKKVKEDLENRASSLKDLPIPSDLIRFLKERAEFTFNESEQFDDMLDNDNDDEDSNSDSNEDIGKAFSEESHIQEFWEEVSAYILVLEEIKSSLVESKFLEYYANKFLDYSKEAMIAFLRPVVVVDGQHRLRAAINSAKNLVQSDVYRPKIEEEILNADEDVDPSVIEYRVAREVARKLPISLLMNHDPAEQVFQFVVVNQKATPIKTALLGTIVSTSLSKEELERVEERLENAGIKLEVSRAVTFLIRYPKSPFYKLVERGLTSDSKELLKWNALGSLVGIFRELKDGKLFHETVDYAAAWKENYLFDSKIVEQWEIEGYKNAFEYWRKLDGPWRSVFIEFWTLVRDKLADVDNDQAWHFWRKPRQSNIFNQTHLKILAADFFKHLHGRGKGIDSIEDISMLVDDWLRGVNLDYFNRDWKLKGGKKDIPGLRKQWSKLWSEYRVNPKKLPPDKDYAILIN